MPGTGKRFKKGSAGGPGRPKGTPNRMTLEVKALIEQAFDQMGGLGSLTAWAETNPTAFYTGLWGKLLPKDLNVTGTVRIDQILAGSWDEEDGKDNDNR